MDLLCDAIAFCYGPATVLKRILECCRPLFTSVTLAGTGTTIEYLARTDLIDEIIEVDTEDLRQMQGSHELNERRWDVLVSVCNPVGFQGLKARARKSVYWDFLLWMRYCGGANEFQADSYVVEMYPGSEQAVLRWGKEIKNLVMCPVLAEWTNSSERIEPGYVLVNLGGQRSKLTRPWENTLYPSEIVNILQCAADDCSYKGKFLVTSDEKTAKRLSMSHNRKNWAFSSLDHDDFLAEVEKAERFFTHPGLYSPFEAIGRGRPTFFLPSSNYTQVLQLREFRGQGIAPFSIDWVDVLGHTVPWGLPEDEGVRQVLGLLEEFNRSTVKSLFIKEITRWLVMSNLDLELMGLQQRRASQHFFGDFKTVVGGLVRAVL